MTTAEPLQPERSVHSPSWAATGAALAALVALYINGKEYVGVWFIAAALIAVHFVPFRMTRNVIVVWIVRLILMAAIVMTTGKRRHGGGAWFFNPDYVSLFGLLCAAELLVQVWQKRKESAPHGEILLLTCLMMMAGTNTFDREYIRFIVPAFVVLLAFSLRAFRRRVRATSSARVPVVGLRWSALVAVLCLGFGTATALYEYGQRVTIFPLSGIFKRPSINSSIAMSPMPVLSSTFNIQPSPTRVLLIEGSYDDGHLRGASFYRYKNNGWDPPSDERKLERTSSHRLERDTGGREVRITRLIHDMGLIYVPLNAASVTAPDDTIEWEKDDGRMLQSLQTWTNRYTYDVALGKSEDYQGPLCVPIDETARKKYLDVPAHVEAAVRPIVEASVTSTEPRRKIVEIAGYLAANHKYSLTVGRRADDIDPLVDFLVNKKDAHCQYFASAAVMMMRCAGIPSRLVSGYYVHERGGPGMVVRQHDAHAWAEAFIDGVGWITVDATPANGRPDQLFGPLTSRWDRFREWLRDLAQQPGLVLRSLPWKWIIIVTVCAAGAWLAVIVLRKLRLRRLLPKPAHNYLYPENDLADVARAFETMLRRKKLPPPGNRTWGEHLSVLRSKPPRQLEDVDLAAWQRFLAEYDAARFGPGEGRETVQALMLRLHQIDPRTR